MEVNENLINAITNNNFDKVKEILSNPNVNPNLPTIKPPVYIAILKKYVNIAKLLIDDPRIDISFGDNYILSPLQLACKVSCYEIVKILLNDSRIDPFIESSFDTGISGTRAYNMACYRGNIDIINLFLNDKRFRPLTEDNQGRSPIYYACLGEQMHIIDLLGNLPDMSLSTIEAAKGLVALYFKTKDIDFVVEMACKLSFYFKLDFNVLSSFFGSVPPELTEKVKVKAFSKVKSARK